MPKRDTDKLFVAIFDNLRGSFGRTWDKLSAEDRELFEELAQDYADLTLQALTDPDDAKVKQGRKEVEASLKSLASIKASEARVEIQSALRDALRQLIGLVVAIV